MPIPILKPTAARDEQFAGVTYHIEGELVPVLRIELGSVPVYFEHHILLWKEPRTQIGIKPLKGAFKHFGDYRGGIPLAIRDLHGPCPSDGSSRARREDQDNFIGRLEAGHAGGRPHGYDAAGAGA